MPSRPHQTRWEDDWWEAFNLLAEIDGGTRTDIIKTGAYSYAGFKIGQLYERCDPRAQALGELFGASEEVVRVWRNAARDWPL